MAEKKSETERTSRRSFFVEMMSWGAGLWVAAAGLSACSDDTSVAKYGGPPTDLGSDGSKVDASKVDGPVAKYGGPLDLGPDAPVAKYGGPVDLGPNGDGPVAKYGGPLDLGSDAPLGKYGGPPVDYGVKKDGFATKYGGPPTDAA